MSPFVSGSLVRARGRDWVVLPGSDDELLLVRPLGGTDDEVTGIYLPLEEVRSATFPPLSPDDLGDFRSARLLRDALRLGFRETTAPLRCLAHIAVEPRPYQLVPLLMALKLEPVRLLIADDVGVGKTVEACLVARELLDRGEIRRLAVLCPPHLAESWWQKVLAEQFHIEAEAVLSGTAARLERDLELGESLFERYPFVVVSTDFIKSDRRWQEFVRTCPEFVIVDEAHTCADPTGGRGGHLRYRLVSTLAQDTSRHLVLVTATPHSGKEEAFRTLLGFLDPSLAKLPADLSPSERKAERERLARHFVQRRRADVQHYLQADTPFPQRESHEETYTLNREYKEFFSKVLAWCREKVREGEGEHHRQRVRWWAALALLRAAGSSPAAAVATLRQRAAGPADETPEEADERGRRALFDTAEEMAEGTDVVPAADPLDDLSSSGPERRELLEMAKAAEALRGHADPKAKRGVEIVRDLLGQGHHPIVFCKFIETAEYVAEALRQSLKGVDVQAVTGRLPHAEREERVAALSRSPRRVLVATDCLSEGINLQQAFDAVVHYDLAWNPTRHEQREGRVDRFGQPRPLVRAVMLYGKDNPVDGIVLDVLLRKHQAIRRSLGVTIPVPDAESVLEAILEGLLLKGRPDRQILDQIELFEREVVEVVKAPFHREWNRNAERERRSRSLFAQAGIKVEEVAEELRLARQALGAPEDVARFTEEALAGLGAVVQRKEGALEVQLAETPRALRDVLGRDGQGFRARFDLPVQEGELYLSRSHPLVEGLAAFVLDTALDPHAPGEVRVAKRGGVVRSRKVGRRSTLLLLRLRFDLVVRKPDGEEDRQVVEEARLMAFSGPPQDPSWLAEGEAEGLLGLEPDANVPPDQARYHLERVLSGLESLLPALEDEARRRAEAVRRGHERVRASAGLRGVRYRVEPKLPVDVLGVYVYLPGG